MHVNVFFYVLRGLLFGIPGMCAGAAGNGIGTGRGMHRTFQKSASFRV